MKDYALFLGNVSKDFTINSMGKNRIKRSYKIFSVVFNSTDTNAFLDVHKYLMERTWYAIMSGLIKIIFIGLLSSIVNASNHTKCLSLSNQKCMIQPAHINFPSNEYSHEFYYYPFSVKLGRWVWRCNTLNWTIYLIKYVFQINSRFKPKRFRYDYKIWWINNI